MFKKVYIEITNVCNLSCHFCSKTEREPFFITDALFEKGLREAVPLTERILFHVKGEPLLHPSFERFVKLAESVGAKLEITTNGTLLRGMENALLMKPVVQINFSLHSLLSNSIDRSEEIISAIISFAKRAAAERPDLYINFRFWNLESEKDSPSNRLLKIVEDEFKTKIGNVDVKRSKNRRLDGRIYLHFDTEFEWPSITGRELGSSGFCYGLSKQIAILSDGTVVPCCLDAEGVTKLGNIKEKTLSEIITDKRAERMKKGFSRFELTEDLCRRCSYIKRFSRRSLERSERE